MKIIYPFLLTVVLVSCAPEKKGTIIARVGSSELTMEEARSHIDTTKGGVDYQLHEYAAGWINAELLFLEAKQKGVESSPGFQSQLADAGRQLAIQWYVESVLGVDTAAANVDSQHNYFEAHQSEFTVRENMLKLHVMVSESREIASTFAANVAQKGGWNNAFSAIHSDSTSAMVNDIPVRYYTPGSIFPPELWKVASSLGISEVSFPIHMGDRFYVVQPVGALQQGKLADFDVARDEVIQRLAVEHRRETYERLLGNLRKRTNVELLLGSGMPPDSTQNHE